MTAWFLGTSEALRPQYHFSPQLQSVATMRELVIRLWPAAVSPSMLANAIETQIENLGGRWPHLPFIPTILVNRARSAGAALPSRTTHRCRIALLHENDPWWIPLSVAAKAAGITKHIMKRLVDTKIVRSKLFSEVNKDGNRKKSRMVDVDHWHQLIDGLFQKAEPVENTNDLTNILRFSLNEVIRDVSNGKMSVFKCKGNALTNLWVCFNQTRTWSKRQRKPIGTLTSSEVAKLLGTYHAVVADLVDREIIKTHDKSHPTRMYINQTTVEEFNKKYILVGTLAKQHGLNSTNLAEKLSSIGVMPVPFGTLVSIYYRTEIEGVSFNMIRKIESYNTKTGRKSTVNSDKVDNPRIKKLIALVEQHGGQTRFSRKFDYSRGTLSSILLGKKLFGPLAAKRMEIRCGLEEGYLSK